MSSPSIRFVCLLLVLLAFEPSTAYPHFQELIPNGDSVPSPCDNQTTWLGVGHTTLGGGSERNQFGLDFFNEGTKWTKALCEMDSDGDQRTNGEELGDPDCVWQPGEKPARKATSHPGICEPMSSPRCQNVIEWVSCEPPKPLHCKHIDENATTTIDLRLSLITVPSSETNYRCQLFDMPSTTALHMIGQKPLIVTTQLVHHIVLFGCESEVSSEMFKEPYACIMVPHPKCRNMISGWTMGSPGDCVYPDMGFRLGKGGYRTVALQVHFNNPRHLEGLKDTSGVRIFVTEQLRPHDAGMLLIGQQFMQIEPLGWREANPGNVWSVSTARGYETIGENKSAPSKPRRRSTSTVEVTYGDDQVVYSSVCPSHCTKVMIKKAIYITLAVNHMHFLGVSQSIGLYRDGKLHKVITDQHNYDYDDPLIKSFADPVMVKPGDELRTTCVFKRPTLGPACWGKATMDEMCFGFLTYFPSENLLLPWCTSVKSLPSCDRHLSMFLGKHPIDGCEWWKFSNTSDPNTKAIYQRVLAMCYSETTGLFCTDQCREVVSSIATHPCLQNDVGTYMLYRMKQYGKMGQMFLDAIITCSCQPFQACERKVMGGFLGTRQGEFCSDASSTMALSSVLAKVLISLFVVSYF